MTLKPQKTVQLVQNVLKPTDTNRNGVRKKKNVKKSKKKKKKKRTNKILFPMETLNHVSNCNQSEYAKVLSEKI